ncbi:FAD-binding protein, partial [Listeria monocytogenes]|nr:FAD-binding protein [Listeria monocytogenes]
YTMGGVKINSKTEVMKKDGETIPGLFAAGEVTGGLHGQNRIGGNSVAEIIIFGRQAGTQAAEFVKK